MCVINIIQTHGYFHALDGVVQPGETVQISTSIPGKTFDVNIINNAFFTGLGKNINTQVNSIVSPVTIGIVGPLSPNNNTNYYTITEISGVIPPITAPPRIIRVV